MEDVRIIDAVSDGISVIAVGKPGGKLSNITLSTINVTNPSVGLRGRHGLWINKDAVGTLTLRKSVVGEIKNESSALS